MRKVIGLLVVCGTFLVVNCITVSSSFEDEGTTLLNNETVIERNNTQSVITETAKILEDISPRTIEVEEKSSEIETTTRIHVIPPTLINAKKLDRTTEAPKKSLKGYATPSPAAIYNKQKVLPEGKLKQAILQSKENSFKTLIDKPVKLKDQVAKPAEIQTDVSRDAPSAKEFVPSPELTPLYSSDNHMQNHFHPVNQYYRHSFKQDARFPDESPQGISPVDSKWLGANRSPNDLLQPPDVVPRFFEHYGLRNTHVEFPHRHTDRHVHLHRQFHHHVNREPMVFPSENPYNEEVRTPVSLPSWPTKAPEQPKGIWKWIPEEEETTTARESDEQRLSSYRPPTFNYEHISRPQTTRDRPYSFESSDIFNHHTTPPSGQGNFWNTGDSPAELLTTEEYTGFTQSSQTHEDSGKEHLNVKLLRSPSPWKRILHVMTAAIPIGLLISALTPRIVYVHPNSTAPTFRPPISQQQTPPPNNPFPQQQQPLNAPFPLRQRSVSAQGLINSDIVDESLTEFLRNMEKQFREKHGSSGSSKECEDRFFCEVALMGAKPNANLMHKMLHHVALETPKSQAERSGLDEIFTAVRRQNCNVFKCKKRRE